MDDIIELSELDFNSNIDTSIKSSNFGSGIELLMNDKVRDRGDKQNTDINLEDLTNLENELNNLVDETSNVDMNSFKPRSNLFNNIDDDKPSVKFMDQPSIGKSTAENSGNTKTWDGYDKFNNIPMNPDKVTPTQPQMTKEELLREKFKFLRKLEALEKKGLNYLKNIRWIHPFKRCKVNMKPL